MSDDENGFFLFMGTGAERGQYQFGIFVVKIAGGLVGQENIGILSQSADDSHSAVYTLKAED